VADGGHWAIQGEGARRVKLLARTKPKWADDFTRRDDVTLWIGRHKYLSSSSMSNVLCCMFLCGWSAFHYRSLTVQFMRFAVIGGGGCLDVVSPRFIGA
jgi:hypothetical protein